MKSTEFESYPQAALTHLKHCVIGRSDGQTGPSYTAKNTAMIARPAGIA